MASPRREDTTFCQELYIMTYIIAKSKKNQSPVKENTQVHIVLKVQTTYFLSFVLSASVILGAGTKSIWYSPLDL